MILAAFLSTLLLILVGWMMFVPEAVQKEEWFWLAVVFGTVSSVLTVLDVVLLKTEIWQALNRFSWMTLFWFLLLYLGLVATVGLRPGPD